MCHAGLIIKLQSHRVFCRDRSVPSFFARVCAAIRTRNPPLLHHFTLCFAKLLSLASDINTLMRITSIYSGVANQQTTLQVKKRNGEPFIGPFGQLAKLLGFVNYSFKRVLATVSNENLLLDGSWFGLSTAGLLLLAAHTGHAEALFRAVPEQAGYVCPLRSLERLFADPSKRPAHAVLHGVRALQIANVWYFCEESLVALFGDVGAEKRVRLSAGIHSAPSTPAADKVG